MIDLELAEQKALFILLCESHIAPGTYFPVSTTLMNYHVQLAPELREQAFRRWIDIGWAKQFWAAGALCVKLRQERYGEAYKQVLHFLDGTSLTIFADQREILTDASATNDTPMRDGWKWLEYERVPSASSVGQPLRRLNIGRLDRWAAITTIIGLPLAILLWWFS